VFVRPLAPADFEACLDLFTVVAGEGHYLATEAPVNRREIRLRWEALLRTGEGALFVAKEVDGAPPAGLAAMVGRGRPELGMLVAPGHRRHGVGSVLLAACLSWARAAGAMEVVLHVFPHNEAAIALYRKHGFEARARILRAYARRNGERWDAIRMVRSLDTGRSLYAPRDGGGWPGSRQPARLTRNRLA